MTLDPETFRDLAVQVGVWMVMAGLVLALIRLARGPSLPDRVVALDMMTIIIAGFCGVFSIFTGDSAFLDVAIVMALIGFLATVALARFAERRVVLSGGGAEIAPPREDAQ